MTLDLTRRQWLGAAAAGEGDRQERDRGGRERPTCRAHAPGTALACGYRCAAGSL